LVGESVVVHDFGEFIRGHVCDCGAEGLEGGVGWGEDGEVWGGQVRVEDFGGEESTFKGGVIILCTRYGNVARGTRRESMICTTPPLNRMSPSTSVLLLTWPPIQTTTFPACLTISTLRPPVRLVQLGKRVGVKTGVPGTKPPANTWVCRT
jgi:hypothetical protein